MIDLKDAIYELNHDIGFDGAEMLTEGECVILLRELEQYRDTGLTPEQIIHWNEYMKSPTMKFLLDMAKRIEKERDAFRDKLYAYEDTGLTPAECAELAQAKRDGRVVEVVRCGECKYFDTDECAMVGYCDGCDCKVDLGFDEKGYCSRGVKKEREAE